MTDDQKKELFRKIGKNRGVTEQELLGLQSDKFFSDLFSHSSGKMPSDKEITQNIEDFFNSRYPSE